MNISTLQSKNQKVYEAFALLNLINYSVCFSKSDMLCLNRYTKLMSLLACCHHQGELFTYWSCGQPPSTLAPPLTDWTCDLPPCQASLTKQVVQYTEVNSAYILHVSSG